MNYRYPIFLALVCALCLAGIPAFSWTTVGTGIEYQAFSASGPNNVFVSRMSRANTAATMDTTIANGTQSGARQITRSQAALYDDAITWWGGSWGQRNDVVVAINGGLFPGATGIVDGGQIQSGWYSHWFVDMGGFSGFGWRNDRTPFIGQCVDHTPALVFVRFPSAGNNTQTIEGINESAPLSNRLYIYTPQYNSQTPSGSRTEVLVEMTQPNLTTSGSDYSVGHIRDVRQNTGSTWIPFDYLVLSADGDAGTTLRNNSSVGADVRIYQQLTDKNQPTVHGTNACQTNTGTNWGNTFSAINVNYHFLENNSIRSPDPNYDGYGGMIVRNPRTCICYDANYVYFVVCDGRSTASVGWTSDEMATFCKNTLGATDGVNLDGGGSSTMVVNGVVQNVPSDGSERAVCNGVMMVNLAPKVQSTTFSAGQTVTVASAANFRLGPGTNYAAMMMQPAGATGTVQTHALNGVLAKGYNWWKVSFSGTVGWIAESLLLGGVVGPPVITQQPSSQSVVIGGTATFIVGSAGSGTLTYQWQKNSANISNGGHYSGTTTSTLTITPADAGDAGNYRCVVTNSEGSVTSDAAALTVSATLLQNGGFENWTGAVTADYWTQYNTSGTVACSKGTTFTGAPSVSAHGGSQYQRVKLDVAGEEGGVYQRFSSTPGVVYTVNVWLLTRLTNVPQVEAKLGVDPTGATVPGGGTTWSSVVSGDSAWTLRSLNITATGSYMTVFVDGKHPDSTANQCNVFFDDAVATGGGPAPPSAPTDGVPVANSVSSITWKWTDLSDETGYRVKDTSGTSKSGDLAANTVQWTEGSLATNTQYTRKIYAFNANGESSGSTGRTKYTLAKAGESTDGTGGTGNVYCTTASKSTWYGAGKTFTFSNPATFGTGGTWRASSFEYKWNKTATEAWSTAGTAWSTGTISLTANAGDGDYYLHVRAFNGDSAANNTDVANYGPFRSDATAPSAVTVTDEGSYTPSQSQLKASWTTSTDSGSGLNRYEYAVGTTSSTQTVKGWTSNLTSTSVTITGLSLVDGTTYYVQARAVDAVGNTSSGSAANGILVAPGVTPISSAWSRTNDTQPLSLRNKIVTAHIGNAFWLEETNRTSAIKVVKAGASVDRGNTVSVAGVLHTDGVTRYLVGDVVINSLGNTVIQPLGVTCRWLGGGNYNTPTPGVTGGYGQYNIGMLVRCWGKVTYYNTADSANKYFYLDDGSGLASNGHNGIKVWCGTVSPPTSGTAIVSGVVSSELVGGTVVPILMIRDGAEIIAP